MLPLRLPTRVVIAGILAEHLTRTALRGVKQWQIGEVTIIIRHQGKKRETTVRLSSLKKIPPRQLQVFLMGHLIANFGTKELGKWFGTHPSNISHLRSGTRPLLPCHVEGLCAAVAMDTSLRNLLKWVARQNRPDHHPPHQLIRPSKRQGTSPSP
jgi:hypothetical protein